MAHPLYNTARWKATRQRILLRDHYTCQVCRCGLVSGRTHPRAAVVDHKIPHNGDAELFWCGDDGLQALCKRDHDSGKQGEESRGYSDRIGADGWPIDQAHPFHTGKMPARWGYSIPHGTQPSGIPVVLVCGAPASGKSTYVDAHARPADTVIDFDAIRQKVGGTMWDQDQGVRARAFAYRAKIIRGLRDKRRGRCWLIVTAPSQAERNTWCKALGNVTVQVMDTTERECIRRIKAAPERREHVDRMIGAVRRWFEQKKRENDQTLSRRRERPS